MCAIRRDFDKHAKLLSRGKRIDDTADSLPFSVGNAVSWGRRF